MNVFFYGLFMDTQWLETQGISVTACVTAYADGFELRIGERATLVPASGSRAYGLMMDVPEKDLATLYSGPGVADYVCESLTVSMPDGSTCDAACYVLPPGELRGANDAYARQLHAVCGELGFPAEYLASIERSHKKTSP